MAVNNKPLQVNQINLDQIVAGIRAIGKMLEEAGNDVQRLGRSIESIRNSAVQVYQSVISLTNAKSMEDVYNNISNIFNEGGKAIKEFAEIIKVLGKYIEPLLNTYSRNSSNTSFYRNFNGMLGYK